MVSGILGFIAATAWWLLFFEPVLGGKVKEASECFYRTTLNCQIGNLVGHIGHIPPYSPLSLWVSTVLFAVGVLTYGLFAARK